MFDKDLALRAERAEAEGFWSLMSSLDQVAVSESRVRTTRITGAPVWSCGAIEWALFNRTIGFGLYGEVQAADLDALMDFYGGRPHSVEASPLAESLKPCLLEERGYAINASRPKFLRSAEPREKVEGVNLRLAESEDAHTYATVVSTSFGMPESAFALIYSIAATPSPMRARVIASIDGQVAGVGFLFVEDGIGWLGGGCCLPEFRGRGVQRALIEGRSGIARDLGANWVTAETNADTAESPGYSMRNMMKCGFEHLYDRPQYFRA